MDKIISTLQLYLPLVLTTTTDENGNNTITYKDKLNQVVCKKMINGAITLIIYYIYDNLGNLCYVIPPLPIASGSNAAVALPTTFTETNVVFLNFCYGYHYDSRKRLIEKKVPGKGGWEYTVYNVLDLPILTQDPNQFSKGIWMATKYDALGRVVMKGEYSSASTRATLQGLSNGTTNLWEIFSNATTNYGYSHVSYPDISTGAGNKVLAVTYYDSYDVTGNAAVNPSVTNFPAPSATIDSLDKHPRNLPVATLVNVLGTTNYLFTVTYYDIYGHAVKVINQNYVGGSPAANKFDTEENQYSFQALSVKSTRKHYFAATTPQLTINTWNTYDHMNRKLLLKQQYKTATDTGLIITVSKVDYNQVGQQLAKHLHSTNAAAIPANSTFLQHINYRYNERGWLSRINNPDSLSDPVFTTVMDVFSEQLDYDQSTNGYTGVTPQYNGNIASLRWQTRVPTGLTETQEVKGYVFTYDPLNRLTGTTYKAVTSGSNVYNEVLTYDNLGNVLTLSRNNNTSATPLNSMTYNYMNAGVRGNQLMSITDSGSPSELQATTYTYNTNGSLITDIKKTLTTPIVYNEINLPSLVTFTTPAKTVTYRYDATGKKLERVIKTGATVSEDRVYDDGIEYSGATASTLELVQTPEGRAIPSAGTYNLQYELTDHLGNVRALITDVNKNGILTADEILQKSDYYAFGREITPGLVPSPDNNYKYNKKEFQQDLAELDYGARFYDPVIARWNVIDPLSEISRRWSPYDYAEDNPIRNIDADGLFTLEGEAAQNWLGDHIRSQRKKKKNTNDDDDDGGGGQGKPKSDLTAKADAARTTSQVPKVKPEIRKQNDWYGPSGKSNYLLGLSAVSTENLSGVARLGSNLKLYSATEKGGVFMGNQFVHTVGLSKAGGLLGKFSFGVGVAIDGYGVYTYFKDPNSPNAVSPAKFGTDTGVGAFGLTGIGTVPAALYFGIDAFYKGGAKGYFNDTADQVYKNVQNDPNYNPLQFVH